MSSDIKRRNEIHVYKNRGEKKLRQVKIVSHNDKKVKKMRLKARPITDISARFDECDQMNIMNFIF